MIQKKTKLRTADNTGIKLTECIHVYKKKHASIGDTILVTIKKLKIKKAKTLQKGSLSKALLVRTKYLHKTKSNNYIQFDENSIILLNKKDQPLGTRVLGPIPTTLRKIKHFKIISVASKLI